MRYKGARGRFVESLMHCGQISEADAEAVCDLYQEYKLVRFDGVDGSINLIHGAYLDKDVIAAAVVDAKRA